MKENLAIGILAYGSLIDDPGDEIQPCTVSRIECETPFPVEYARISKTRGNAPTLIPVNVGYGAMVTAQILVLRADITLETATNMLWRRETRQNDSSKIYKPPKKDNKNGVRVEVIENFCGVDVVIYTSIPPNIELDSSPDTLAKFAVESILSEAGERKLDGVRYLAAAYSNGIVTPKSEQFKERILTLAKANTLAEAISNLDKRRPVENLVRQEFLDFEHLVKTIADNAFQFGFNQTLPNPTVRGEEVFEQLQSKKEEFLINCHTGFKRAQDAVVELVRGIQDEIEVKKLQIKEARKKREFENAKKLEYESKVLAFKEQVLRHIIDGILWQMIGGQLYVARRLYQHVPGAKILKHSNIESTLLVANSINKNEKDFALLSDLTTYVQIGDLICVKDGILQIVEVKDGTHNHAILKIAKNIISSEGNVKDILTEQNLDLKSSQQLLRQLRQFGVGQSFVNIINHDEGTDFKTGDKIKIHTPAENTRMYDDKLIHLQQQLDRNGLWSYDLIDGCLHIGMYKNEFRVMGPRILKALAERSTKNYVIKDLRQAMNSINRPLFMLPFLRDAIFDIIFGRVHVWFLLDLDAFISLYKAAGYNVRWGTRRETMKAIEQLGRKDIFRHDNKGIRVELQEGEMWLAHGTLWKVIFEHIYPSYMVHMTKYNGQ